MRGFDAATVLEPDDATSARVDTLNSRYRGLSAHDIVAVGVEELFFGRIALVSSFGSESAVLLHLLSEIEPRVPVLFIDTGRLFSETLEYRRLLTDRLGLRDVRTINPSEERLAALDPVKALWMTNPDLCCRIRKTEPLAHAIVEFDAWFTGRKRFQSSARAGLPLFEGEGHRIKINPLTDWTAAELMGYASEHELPQHPLVAQGYPSIGCVPCTDRVLPGEDQRSGRWRGTDKDECGIHFGLESDGSGI
ncbi:MAG: phosphoadenylyl-sulfate reductase [Alphaproteobacteria bacterium]